MKNIPIAMELVLPIYNAHPHFSLKNVGKSAHYTQWNTELAGYLYPEISQVNVLCIVFLDLPKPNGKYGIDHIIASMKLPCTLPHWAFMRSLFLQLL